MPYFKIFEKIKLIYHNLYQVGNAIHYPQARKHIYHLETSDFNRGVNQYSETHLSSLQNITSDNCRCGCFVKMIDVRSGHIPHSQIEIGGFKMIDVFSRMWTMYRGRKLAHLTVLFFIVCLTQSCANVGVLKGSPKDTTPPKIVESKSTPNLQTRFKKQPILLTFDEWVKLEDAFSCHPL